MYKSILNGWSHSKPKLQLAAEGAREYYLQVEKKENIVGDSEGETQELELGIVDDGWRGVSSIFFYYYYYYYLNIFPIVCPKSTKAYQGDSQ